MSYKQETGLYKYRPGESRQKINTHWA